jgi:hypothetical protein
VTDQRLERLYAQAETKNEVRKAATVRRGPVSLIAVCLGVALVVGITAAVDLRRLQTPRGTALAWTGAAVFGDCTAYRELSVGRDGDDGAECRALRAATEEARDRPGDVDLSVVSVQEDGDRATVVLAVRRDDEEQRVAIGLREEDGDWRVVPEGEVCEAVLCP